MKSIVTPLLVVPFVIALGTPAARADVTRAQCAESYERAQYLRKEAKLTEAREVLLVCSQDACPAVVKNDCVPWLSEVERSMPSIVVAVRDDGGKDVVGAKFSIDGGAMSAADGRPMQLDPGPHKLRAETPDGRSTEEQIVVRIAEKNRALTVVLAKAGPQQQPSTEKPITEPPGEAGSGRSLALPIALTAVGAVGLGAALFFGFSAKSEADDVRARCAPRCPDGELDGTRTKLLISDIGLGVGIVALAAATYFFLSAPSAAKTSTAGVSSGAAVARSRFASEGALIGIAAAVALLVGCRLFVDLDGIVGDAVVPAPEAGSDVQDGAVVDAPGVDSSDASTIPDVIEEPPPDGACTSKGGPTPLRITSGAITFCMDTTQVSFLQYDAFLASSPVLGNQIAACAWNSTFVPSSYPYDPNDKDLPVVATDWCDAYAFCAWAGKRMCGGIGGAAITPAEVNDPTKSERMFACSKGGTRAYPYGNTYSATACNGSDKAVGGALAVGSQSTCQGGFDGLFDLSGNVHEWLGVCGAPDAGAGEQDAPCVETGASWGHPMSDMACSKSFTSDRDGVSGDTGFRCCSP